MKRAKSRKKTSNTSNNPYMAQGKKITTKEWNEFLKKLEEMLGLIGATCEAMNINRWTYYNRRVRDSEFAKNVDKIVEQIGTPFVEDKLREAIFRGEGWAIKFYLQCKSKKWRPYEGRQVSGQVRTEVEQKIRTDPLLKKAARFYEAELKKRIMKRNQEKH